MKNLKRALFLSIVLGLSANSFAQNARMVINDDAYVVMSNDVFVVLDNPNTNAISTAGTGGNLVSEGENNRLRWNIGTTASGTYTVPFTSSPSGTDTKIPLSLSITAAGTGATGSLDFATYGTAATDNLPFPQVQAPASVTVTDVNKGGSDNSAYVIDRFWVVDAHDYTGKPQVGLTFTYIDSEHGGQSITESNLQAQRWEKSPSDWGEFIAGTINTTNNTVGVPVTDVTDFEAVWTLTDNTSALPVELVYFTAEWSSDDFEAADLEWQTNAEINNDYFEVQKSIDGVNFEAIEQVDSKNIDGNSSHPTNYETVDNDPYLEGTSYYRLRQVDFNGDFKYSNIEVLNPENNFDLITLFPNPNNGKFTYMIYSSEAKEIEVEIVNNLGQVVLNENGVVNRGVTTLDLDVSSLASSNYIIRVSTNTDMVHREFVSSHN